MHPSLVAAPHAVEAPRIESRQLAGDRARLVNSLSDELVEVHLGVEPAEGPRRLASGPWTSVIATGPASS